MVQFAKNPPPFRPRKTLEAEWKSFRKGLNLLLRPTELGRDEYETGDNILLIGSGVPTGRWGSTAYFTANATGSARGFATYNNTASLTNEIITLTDQGYLVKKNGSTSTTITGQSYPSGTVVRSEQLGGYTYFVSKDVTLTQYNGTSLVAFATLTGPRSAAATNISGVSGTAIWSWKITTLSTNGGETTGTQVQLPNLPQDLTTTQINVMWSAPSAATLSGYQIYRGFPGDETFLAAVGASTTTFIDTGQASSETILSPLTNTTGGVKSQFITKFNDRLLMVNKDEPTKLLISGRYPNHSKFNWIDGGGYIYIDPDSGQDITGIAVQPGNDKIIVYKDYAHYAVHLDTVSIGNFNVLDPTYQAVSTGVGACNPDTIQIVENDIFYFGRKGLYVTGFEPNFLNIIRTNEISARLRPYLANLAQIDYQTAVSMYVNNKYIISFPNRGEAIVYDRERGCFAGLWKFPFGISRMIRYVDGTGTEKWVFGISTSNQIYNFEADGVSDNGATIAKTLNLNKEQFDTWSRLKIVKLFFILFRNIVGTVTVSLTLEDRNGSSSTIKSFTITGSDAIGNSGWGAGLWGNHQWGDTEGIPVAGGDELTRWAQLFKSGRLVQISITVTAANSNFELLGARFTASSQGDGSLSAQQRV